MGGEGAALAAIKSLKNNRNLLKKKRKGVLCGSYADIELKDLPEATSEQLLNIKTRIRKENKQARINRLIAFTVFILILIASFFYLIH